MMSTKRGHVRALVVGLGWLVVTAAGAGCDDAASKGEAISPEPTGSARPTTSASAAAATAPDKDGKGDAKKDEGPVVWPDFPGPEVQLDLSGAPQAWCVLPVSTSFQSLKFARTPVDKPEGSGHVMSGYKKSLVPNAFIFKTDPPSALKSGDSVLAAVYATGVHAKVVEVGDKVKVKLQFAGKEAEESVTKEQLIVLHGKELSFGEPVAYKEGDKWLHAFFVHKGDDKSWVLEHSGKAKEVPTADIKNLTIDQKYDKGDKVWVRKYSDLVPGKVVSVNEGGAILKVDLDGTEKEVPYSDVTSPLK